MQRALQPLAWLWSLKECFKAHLIPKRYNQPREITLRRDAYSVAINKQLFKLNKQGVFYHHNCYDQSTSAITIYIRIWTLLFNSESQIQERISVVKGMKELVYQSSSLLHSILIQFFADTHLYLQNYWK